MMKSFLTLAAIAFLAGCVPSPVRDAARAVNLTALTYRLADDASRVYWQCPVVNRTTGTMTVCIEPSVQVMAEINIDACKTKWGEAWVNHFVPANGAEWVSPSTQTTATLRPGESKTLHGEIALPEKYHKQRISIVNRTACSAEGQVQ
jgi:hypothetical protein